MSTGLSSYSKELRSDIANRRKNCKGLGGLGAEDYFKSVKREYTKPTTERGKRRSPKFWETH